jgi:hypothetical protein
MTTDTSRIGTNHKEKKNKFWLIALGLLAGLTGLTLLLEYLESRVVHDSWMTIPYLPIMPGFFIYVIITGDIHGWKPGPIGQEGRIIVTIIASWVVWTLIAYVVCRRFKK